MMAALAAAEAGAAVVLLEKTRRLGAKVRLAGGGRCNVTTSRTAWRDLLAMYPAGGIFLKPALRRFSPTHLRERLAREGVPTRVEAGTGKVFPASDRAEDVVAALSRALAAAGVTVRLQTAVAGLETASGRVRGVHLGDGTLEPADAVIVATGGKTWPRTGSTGDGYAWAATVGHRVTPLFPSLVPLRTPHVRPLAGVAVPDVSARVWVGDRPQGEPWREALLFTHAGLSGPVVLQASRAAAAALAAGGSAVRLRVNFVPERGPADLDRALQDSWQSNSRQELATSLQAWGPRALLRWLLAQAGLDGHQRVAEVGRPVRQRVVRMLSDWAFPITGWQDFALGEVTAGGVALDEIDPDTLGSRLVAGLFWAGEVLDVDGYVGGYNLQAAWSTGWLAGKAAAGDLTPDPSP